MSRFIIEVANTHGGNIEYLKSLIEEFEEFNDFGMKFQPLHPDRIALKDYEWYQVYEELYFDPKQWNIIIKLASQSKLVWLDLFDSYGVDILRENLDLIHGIKLQASVLYNLDVLSALEDVNCSNLKLIINVSAIELAEIKERLGFYKTKIGAKSILIEVGFQAYPTNLADSGLNKLQELKARFENPIVFADHIEGSLPDAIRLPLIASLSGADYIEKHVMHSKLETKYDHFSSIQIDKFRELVEAVKAYGELSSKPFINKREIEYLENSIQKPILNKDLSPRSIVCFNQDLSFKRSNQNGLSYSQLLALQKEKCIISNEVSNGSALKRENFKKATIATIIAGRLKSTRLKNKALLKIGNISSIEKCIQSCLKIKSSNFTILATSTTEQDSYLANYTYRPNVKFIQGHPDDVIQRYLDAIDKFDVDVVIRVTADMPYVSWELTEFLLDKHFETGADYTAAKDFAVGTVPEIINTKALKEVKKHFPKAEYSEYMTWYFQNNKEYFKINFVDLPAEYIRDYRLTIDYLEDLEMMNILQDNMDQKNLDGNLKDIFDFLDESPQVVAINGHIGLTYKTDQNLIDTLNRVTKIAN